MSHPKSAVDASGKPVNPLVKAGRIFVGAVVVLLGIIMLPLPGPGWVTIAAGFGILSKDIPWCHRVVVKIREKVPGVPKDGKIPPKTIAIMAAITIGTVAISLWWNFGR